MPVNKAKNKFLTIVHEAEVACNTGRFSHAEQLYSTALRVEPRNPLLYCNRSATRIYLGNYEGARKDAEEAVALEPKSGQGLFRLGVALQHCEKHYESLVALSKAMSIEAQNLTFLNMLIEVSLRSTLKRSLEPVMGQLKEMNLESNPFVVTSVIGQDLLAHGATDEAVEVLECAISIGTPSLKLKGSVYSALSSALWSLDLFERAIAYMKEDLRVSRSLEDAPGECRAHGNLAAARLFQGRYQDAADSYKAQLLLAQKLKHKRLTASAYDGLGLVCSGLGDHQQALRHHRFACDIALQTKDYALQCRELAKLGQCLLVTGDLTGALTAQKERLVLAVERLKDGGKEEAQAHLDMSAVHKAEKRYPEEVSCLQKAVQIFKSLSDSSNESKSLIALGYAARQQGDWLAAKATYERLLELALETNDKALEGRACANLGIVHHQQSDFELALKLQARCLAVAIDTGDLASQGRSYGNMGNAYSALGLYEQAVDYHLKELEISTKINDKQSECSTHGNLAVAYQAMQQQDRALHHYRCQYDLAKEIGSAANLSRSLMNLGNFHNALGRFDDAVELYREYLALAEADKSGQCRALYNLGFAHFSMRRYDAAVESYLQSVAVATECQDRLAMARAYCNLGLARKEQGEFELAFECQSKFLALATELKSARGKFKALGNLGDVFSAGGQADQATGFYQQQLTLAEAQRDPLLIAQACASLGTALRGLSNYEQALILHEREVELYRRAVIEAKVEYKAQGRLGATLTSLGRFEDALPCYERQLELARSSGERFIEAQAHANLAITHTNMRHFELAKDHFDLQVRALHAIKGKSARVEKCKALRNLGECCETLEDFDEAAACHQAALELSSVLRDHALMEKALRGLAAASKHKHDLERALAFCQQRLTVCERLDDQRLTASAHGEIAYVLASLKRHSEAVEQLKAQMKIGVDLSDQGVAGDAACGLGSVYRLMDDRDAAVKFHRLDLEISQQSGNQPGQGRAHGNLAAVLTEMGEYDLAIGHQEQHLFIANEEGDELAKQTALYGIARCILMKNESDFSRSALLLQQALLLHSEATGPDLAIKTRHSLGLVMLACGDTNSAVDHLRKAVKLAEDACLELLADSAPGHIVTSECERGLEAHRLLCESRSALLYVLSKSGRHEEALEIAERGNSRDFFSPGSEENSATVEEMQAHCRERDACLLYLALSAGHLFRWLVTPEGRVLGAGCVSLGKNDDNNTLIGLVLDLWQSLGVDSSDCEERPADEKESDDSETTIFATLLEHSEEFKLSQAHITIGSGLLMPSPESSKTYGASKSAVYSLHELLIGDFESELLRFASAQSPRSLQVVADGLLLTVPFGMLKRKPSDQFLSRRFLISAADSFERLRKQKYREPRDLSRALVVGNPSQPGEAQSQAAEEESSLVAGVLRVLPLTGSEARVAAVAERIENVEVIHFACQLSTEGPIGFKLLADNCDEPDSPRQSELEIPAESSDGDVLSLADLLALDLTHAKLVVIGAPYLRKAVSGAGSLRESALAIAAVAQSLLAAGAHSVLFPRWPVPETAWKMAAQTFYDALLSGAASHKALAAAVTSLRGSQQFGHPSYWAAFALVGPEVTLSGRDLSTVYALAEVLRGDGNDAQAAIKLANHLVVKSMQRAASSGGAFDKVDSLPMYTSQESVAGKLNNARGWRQLFAAAGFDLRPSCNGLPPAVFFPSQDSRDTLEKVSGLLATFADLPAELLSSVGRLTLSSRAALDTLRWLERVQRSAPDGVRSSTNQIARKLEIERALWERDGCSQLLSALGINMTTINENSVSLSAVTLRGDQQTLPAATRALTVMFGEVSPTSPDATSCETPPPKSTSRQKVPRLSALRSQAARPGAGDFPVPLDFDSSYQSLSASDEGSAPAQQDAWDRSLVGADCGILTLEEPRVFTQVPDVSAGLVAPTPVMAAKPSLTIASIKPPSPASTSSFSPSKNLQPISPSSNHDQTSRPTKSNTTPTLAPKGPHSPGKGPTGLFYQGPSRDAKVCVVNPTPGEKSSPKPAPLARRASAEERFMSVFESMLVKPPSDTPERRKGSLTSESHTSSSVKVRRSSDGYKPSPSVASCLKASTNSSPPLREYDDIVSRLAQAKVAPLANLEHTHTAYRVVRGADARTVQAYKVQTVFTPISDAPPVVAASSRRRPQGSPQSNRQSSPKGGLSLRSLPGSSPRGSRPPASPGAKSDIFQHLSERDVPGRQPEEERIEFV